MLEKFKGRDFGCCPRVFCNGQACLPVGLSDVPGHSTVKLFCPKCEDVYYPRSKYHGNLDGESADVILAAYKLTSTCGLKLCENVLLAVIEIPWQPGEGARW